MRLLYVTVSMPFGTGEEFLIAEVHELLRQGHEVLIVPRSPKAEIVNQDALDFERISVRECLLSPKVLAAACLEMIRRPLGGMRAFGLLLEDMSPAVFLKNLVVFPKGLWLSRLAREWRADHIHVQWGLTTATMVMTASHVSGLAWSMTLHRGDIASANLLASKTARAGFTRFISESGRRMAKSRGRLSCSAQSVVIHMGVPLPDRSQSRPVLHDRFVVLCPAQLSPVKGHRYLIDALAELRDQGVRVQLLLAGEGGLQQELEQQVGALGLRDQVDFLGGVTHERLLGWYRDGRVDAVVLPSVDLGDNLHEGIPVALIEAMSYGVPVVSTETGGIPELLHDGAGLLVPHQNSALLANAIEQLAESEELCVQLAAAGRRRVEEQFSVSRTVEELTACINAHRVPSFLGQEH